MGHIVIQYKHSAQYLHHCPVTGDSFNIQGLVFYSEKPVSEF